MGLRTLLVGYGWWGKILEAALNRDPEIGLDLCGIVTLDSGALAISEAPLYSDLGVALDTLKPQAVLLATPHSVHASQIQMAASAGCHVFCEKPLALSLTDAMQAIEACQQANVVLGVGFQRRTWPTYEAMRSLVESGALGELRLMEGNYSNNTDVAKISGKWRDQRSETPGPLGLTGMSIHPLDQMVGLVGPLEKVSPVLVETASSVGLRFRKGTLATLSWMQGTPEYYRLAVFGTRGWAELIGPNEGRWKLESGEEGSLDSSISFADPVSVNLGRFAIAAQSKGQWPVPADELKHTVNALEKVISACEGAECFESGI